MNASLFEVYRQVNAGDSNNAGTATGISNDAHSEEQQRPARPRMTLIVVNAQNNFSAGGTLAVGGTGAAYTATYLHVAGTANEYSVLATTRDNHIGPDTHFSETPDFVDTWPKHCVAGTPDAEVHPGMQRAITLFEQFNPAAVHTDVTKGEYATTYSGFKGTTKADVSLADTLHASDIKEIDVVGVATGHCVRAAVPDGLKEGFSVRVLSNQVAAADPERGEATLAELAVTGTAVV